MGLVEIWRVILGKEVSHEDVQGTRQCKHFDTTMDLHKESKRRTDPLTLSPPPRLCLGLELWHRTQLVVLPPP